jgi:hypothetical protein
VRLAVPDRILPRDPLDVVLNGRHESCDVSAYEASARVACGGEAAGFDTDTLVAMLDQSIPLQKVLELIVSKAKCSQKAA